MGNAYKKLDLFGEHVSFTINGDDAQKSLCGAFLSMIIVIIVASYAFDNFIIMWEFGETSHQSVITENSVDPTRVFPQSETKLNFAFGVSLRETWLSNEELLGYAQWTFVRYDEDEDGTYNRTTFYETHPCT